MSFFNILPFLDSMLDIFYPDPQARSQARLEIMTQKGTHKIKTLEKQLSVIVQEASSNDPWVRRARPSFLYVMYVVILLCPIGGIVSIWFPNEVLQAAEGTARLLQAIPDALWTLFGAGYLGYTCLRSYDKKTMLKERDK